MFLETCFIILNKGFRWEEAFIKKETIALHGFPYKRLHFHVLDFNANTDPISWVSAFVNSLLILSVLPLPEKQNWPSIQHWNCQCLNIDVWNLSHGPFWFSVPKVLSIHYCYFLKNILISIFNLNLEIVETAESRDAILFWLAIFRRRNLFTLTSEVIFFPQKLNYLDIYPIFYHI